MGRPPALTDRQKAEIGRRLAQGESGRSLAKEFKVSEWTIRANVSTHKETIKDVAMRLATAETDFEVLDLSTQVATRTLADQYKRMSKGMAEVAADGVEVGQMLGRIAKEKAKKLNVESDMESLRETVAFQEGANRALVPATSIMNANKNATPDAGGNLTVVSGVPHD